MKKTLLLLGILFISACSADSEFGVKENSHMHHHETIDLDASDDVPQVDLIVHKDPKSGWNLQVLTENFQFTPENASLEHVGNEGHAHLYVNGEKLTRLYGEWYYLDGLAPGEYELKVDLNSNNHFVYTLEGEEVSDLEIIVQE